VSSPENIDVFGAAPEAEAAPAGEGFAWAADAQPKLTVTRGLKQNLDYTLYPGQNYIGRADEKPVDVDLDDQEPPDRVWSSRQHALILFENGALTLEDLNSANGTFVNRAKLPPGQKATLKPDDVIQIGTVQLKVKA
jgi:pSer/pThr/pTyr-binding forkhead associated (FHA) protein